MKKLLLGCVAVLSVGGCHELTPQQQAAVDLFECRAHVLLPYAGAVFDVEELVREAAKGQLDISKALGSLGLALDDIAKIWAEYTACEPTPVLVAPIPAPGDKVM